jgi:hypothetical protein
VFILCIVLRYCSGLALDAWAAGKYLDLLTDISFCPALNRVALGGGTSVKVVDCGAEYNELKGDAVELDVGQSVEKLGWTPDGQVGDTVACALVVDYTRIASGLVTAVLVHSGSWQFVSWTWSALMLMECDCSTCGQTGSMACWCPHTSAAPVLLPCW